MVFIKGINTEPGQWYKLDIWGYIANSGLTFLVLIPWWEEKKTNKDFLGFFPLQSVIDFNVLWRVLGSSLIFATVVSCDLGQVIIFLGPQFLPRCTFSNVGRDRNMYFHTQILRSKPHKVNHFCCKCMHVYLEYFCLLETSLLLLCSC